MDASSIRSVLVTGASTGIGKACTLHLAQRGFKVFAGVRKLADGEALVKQAKGHLLPLMLDVTDSLTIAAAASRIAEAVGTDGLSGLVNNAGISVVGPLEFMPVDELRRQLEVNVVGQLAVTQACLPLLRKARGRIVNISSVSGLVALPFMGPYAASKHALEALSDSLRVELAPFGIHVAVVEPGSVATPIWGKIFRASQAAWERLPTEAKQYYGKVADAIRTRAGRFSSQGDPPEVVARAVAHALTSKRPGLRYPVAKGALSVAFLAKAMPDRLRDFLIHRELRHK